MLVHPTAPSVIYAGTSNNGLFRGSTLHHLTMKPVSSPQYVDRPFPITVTARDELGFPLTSPSQVELRAWAEQDSALVETLSAGGFDGMATLTDTTNTIQPSEITFANGVAAGDVTIAAEVNAGIMTAAAPAGRSVTSNPFDVIVLRVYLPLIVRSLDS